jgi:hypothetical protein
LVYSTYLGGISDDYGNGIAVDAGGDAYVTGVTYSANFPTQSPFQVSNGGSSDAFVTRLSSAGSGLIYSTCLGGSNGEDSHGIAVDAGGNTYVTGSTGSANFPTQNPFQASYGDGTSDAFVTKFSYDYPCGDSNGDLQVTVADIEYLTNFYFSTGPRPPLATSCDMDCDGLIHLNDIIMLAWYVYGYGFTPCCVPVPPPKRPELRQRDSFDGWPD